MLRAATWLAVAGVFGALGYSSYLSGSMLARQEVSRLEEAMERLRSQLQAERMDTDRLKMELAQSREAGDALKRRYDTNVPSGGLATLVTLLKDRLNGGIKETRMAQVMRDAEAVRPCEERVLRKRFAISDPGVSFLDGLIQVSASAPAGAEDLAKAATITITRVWASQPIKATGFPLHQSIAINNVELKLSVEASDLRGYGTASLSVCGRV